jgi:hypothetical protein
VDHTLDFEDIQDEIDLGYIPDLEDNIVYNPDLENDVVYDPTLEFENYNLYLDSDY